MNELDRAWLAGFFDGDGYLRTNPPEIYINQKDPTILTEIKTILEIGHITGFTGYKGHRYFRIILRSNRDIKRFYEVVRPYMRGPKAEKLDDLYYSIFTSIAL